MRPGENIHVYGSVGACQADTVTIVSKAFPRAHTYNGQGAVYTPVQRGGKFSAHIQIPSSLKGASYKISALCGRFPMHGVRQQARTAHQPARTPAVTGRVTVRGAPATRQASFAF